MVLRYIVMQRRDAVKDFFSSQPGQATVGWLDAFRGSEISGPVFAKEHLKIKTMLAQILHEVIQQDTSSAFIDI